MKNFIMQRSSTFSSNSTQPKDITPEERERIQGVVNYWFAPEDFDRVHAGGAQMKRWYSSGKEGDEEIREIDDLTNTVELPASLWAKENDS